MYGHVHAALLHTIHYSMRVAYMSIVNAPVVITDSAPRSLELNLHTTLVTSNSAHQSDGELGASGIYCWRIKLLNFNTSKLG